MVRWMATEPGIWSREARTDMTEVIDGRLARGHRRRQQLIEAAIRVAIRDGVAAITHRSVAKEARLAATAGTYYFPTVDDLLAAVTIAGLTEFGDAVTRRMRRSPTLRAFAEVNIELLHRDRGRVIAAYELYLLAARRPELTSIAVRWTDFVRETLTRWSSDETALTATIAALDGICLKALIGSDPDVDEVEGLLQRTLGATGR